MTQIDLSLEHLGRMLEQLGISSSTPIIVLGMHRSGTTMLVKVLQRAGVFMGSRLSGNLEPRIFQDANRQIFDYFGASWLDGYLLPEPVDFQKSFSGLAAAIANRLSEDLPIAFFDAAPASCRLWGFKDPRTSVTAGLFLRLFPMARVIFIHRDPLDVALSIVTRERKRMRKFPGMETFEYSPVEFQSLMFKAIKAWETYNERVLKVLPLVQCHTVLRYESVVAAPIDSLIPTLASIGISISGEAIANVGICPERVGVATKSKIDVDLSELRTFLAESEVAIRLSEVSIAT